MVLLLLKPEESLDFQGEGSMLQQMFDLNDPFNWVIWQADSV